MSIWAVIVAAGKGERTGFTENKVLRPINGVSALSMCIAAFKSSELINGAVIVASEHDYELIKQEHSSDFVKNIVIGGKTRQESVFNGLKSVLSIPKSVCNADIVAIHDAARPFVTREILGECVESAQKCGSGIAATRVTDTIKETLEDGSVRTPLRDRLWAAQTPQTFRLNEIISAYEKAADANYSATDDAALYERYIGNVSPVFTQSGEENVKLTTKRDFMRLESDIRIGHGYDAHRLVEGRALVLCGEKIEHNLGLDGHSDADVATHALIDAMLGAAAMGDIGKMFPDSDEKYKGISSLTLLGEARDALANNGWFVSNADITIIAQKPKLASYIESMRRNIADVFNVNVDSISVKATTTEKMGFEGACEGISAHSVVMIRRRH